MGTMVRRGTAASTVELAALLSARAEDVDELAGDDVEFDVPWGGRCVALDGELTLVTPDRSCLHFGVAGRGARLIAGWPASVPVPAGRIVSSASVPEGWAVMVEVADPAAAAAGVLAIVDRGFATAAIWGPVEIADSLLDIVADDGAAAGDTVWLEDDRYLVAYTTEPGDCGAVVQIEVSYRDR